jgi:hypothetical protein
LNEWYTEIRGTDTSDDELTPEEEAKQQEIGEKMDIEDWIFAIGEILIEPLCKN